MFTFNSYLHTIACVLTYLVVMSSDQFSSGCTYCVALDFYLMSYMFFSILALCVYFFFVWILMFIWAFIEGCCGLCGNNCPICALDETTCVVRIQLVIATYIHTAIYAVCCCGKRNDHGCVCKIYEKDLKIWQVILLLYSIPIFLLIIAILTDSGMQSDNPFFVFIAILLFIHISISVLNVIMPNYIHNISVQYRLIYSFMVMSLSYLEIFSIFLWISVFFYFDEIGDKILVYSWTALWFLTIPLSSVFFFICYLNKYILNNIDKLQLGDAYNTALVDWAVYSNVSLRNILHRHKRQALDKIYCILHAANYHFCFNSRARRLTVSINQSKSNYLSLEDMEFNHTLNDERCSQIQLLYMKNQTIESKLEHIENLIVSNELFDKKKRKKMYIKRIVFGIYVMLKCIVLIIYPTVWFIDFYVSDDIEQSDSFFDWIILSNNNFQHLFVFLMISLQIGVSIYVVLFGYIVYRIHKDYVRYLESLINNNALVHHINNFKNIDKMFTKIDRETPTLHCLLNAGMLMEIANIIMQYLYAKKVKDDVRIRNI